MFDLYLHADGRFFNFETFEPLKQKTENALQGAPMDVWDMDNSSAVPDACRENIEGKGWGGRGLLETILEANSCCKF